MVENEELIYRQIYFTTQTQVLMGMPWVIKNDVF